MSNSTARRALSLLIVGAMVLSGVLVLVTAAPVASARANESSAGSATGVTRTPSTVANPSTLTDPTQDSWSIKLDPTLRDAAIQGTKDLRTVVIYAADLNSVAPLLNKYGVRSLPDDLAETSAQSELRRLATSDGIVSTTVQVPGYALAEIAKVPGVLGIDKPFAPTTTDYTNADLLDARAQIGELKARLAEIGAVPTPLDWGVIRAHHANSSEVLGYNGTGVNIAVQDWGLDFAHPNLIGRWATVNDTSSPYNGYPIMHSQESLWNNLQLFTADSDLLRNPYPLFAGAGTASWFSATTYQATATDGSLEYTTGFVYDVNGDGSLDFQATNTKAPTWSACPGASDRISRTYYVGTGGPGTITSASGWFHLGVHKDKYLEGYYCERVGILVVDSTTPGVYDQVYVDLDDDWDFTNDAPLSVTGSPLSALDLTGDGVADISGGLLYYISNRTRTIPNEVVISSATGKEKKATLAHGWIETDTWGLPGVSEYMNAVTLTQNSTYWPSSTEDIRTTLLTNQAVTDGMVSNLAQGVNVLNRMTVNATWLLQHYDLGVIYDLSGTWVIPGRPPVKNGTILLSSVGSPSDTQVGVGGGWINPTNAFASDDVYATAAGYTTKSQVWSGFGLSIPTDAVVTKVTVRSEWFRSNVFSGSLNVRTTANGGTTWSSSHSVADRTAEGTDRIDVTLDATWTPAIVNSANFQVELSFAGGLSQANVDWLSVEVSYKPAEWTNAPNAGTSDDTYATADGTTPKGSTWYDFTFNLPGSGAISSVAAKVEWFRSGASPGTLTLYASADSGTTWGPGHAIADRTAEGVSTVAITGDAAWSAAILNSTKLRIALVFSGAGATANLDQITIVIGQAASLVADRDYRVDMANGTFTWLFNSRYNLTATTRYQFDTWRVNFDNGTITFQAPPVAGMKLNATYNTGLPVPYANITAQRQGWDLFVPGPGDLVAFHGAFELGQEHGTWVSSLIGGQPFGNSDGIFDIYGTSPNARLIAVDLPTSIDTAELFYFSSHGYDGLAKTGDEAQIDTNSWGQTRPENTGFTFLERYLYDLTTYKVPDFTILFAAGNNGPGYATSTPPNTAPGVITVGAGMDMNYRRLFGFLGLGGDGGGAFYDWPFFGTGAFGAGPYGDLADFTSHGPTLMGTPEPDVFAAGEFVFGGRPLNSACLDFGCDGTGAFDLVAGTSFATPITAGVVALIYQSYRNVTGVWPSSTVAKEILMSSADDHGFDVLSQGAGWVNASAAVKLANATAGFRVSPSSLAPGTFGGVHRPAFANLMKPGDSYVATLTVTNPTASAATYAIGDAYYTKVGPDFTFYFDHAVADPGATQRILKPTGLYASDGATQLDPTDISARWNAADFIRITAIRDPATTSTTPAPFVQLFDWCDLLICGGNGNGLYGGFAERNRMTFMLPGAGATSASVDLYNPKDRIQSGLVFSLRDTANAFGRVPVVVEFYGKADWAWATESVASLLVPAGSSMSFTSTFTVPAGTQAGMYQAAVMVSLGSRHVLVPVLITVPYTGLPLSFGGATPSNSLYDNNAVGQGQMPGTWRQIGDSRLFWADFSAAPAANRRMIYDLLMHDAPSEGEITVFALEPDTAWTNGTIYGPGAMVEVASTKEVLGATDTLYPHREFLHTDVMSGPLAIQVKALRSVAANEPFSLDVGVMQTDPDIVRISTSRLSGSVPVSVTSSVPLQDGLATAVTELVTTKFLNRDVVSYPFPGGAFINYLFGAPNKVKTVIPAGTIVATWSLFFYAGASDVDVGIFYDADCDGVYTVADDAVGTVAATSSNPETASLSFPAAGCYWVHAAGFTVAATGGKFDLTLSINKIGVSAFSSSANPTSTVAANTPTGFNISWDFAGGTPEGLQAGFLFSSPGFAPFALAQQLTIRFSYDITPPTFSSQLPAQGSVVGDSTPGMFVQINDNQPGAFEARGEIDQTKIRVWLDGGDITSIASISVPHSTNVGYPTGTVLFTPTWPLSDGRHTVTVQAGDFAGNLATTVWSFTVDTMAPRLDITSPTPGLSTSAATVTVSGQTEPGASVSVGGSSVFVDGAGAFSTSVALVEGTNTIDVSATDALGNTASTALTVVSDSTAPAISLLRSSAGLLTLNDLTVVSGVVSEASSLTVAGIPATVHADGSFAVPVSLGEGSNSIAIVATDAAGNQGSASLTVTRDTTPPTLTMDALPSEVSSATVTVSGSVETGISFVTVNGQPVTVSAGRYSTSIALSFGSNVIFVEATDAAGNTATSSRAVSYVPQGVSTASVGLILLPVLTVIALLVGLAIGQARRGRGGGGGGGEGGMKIEEMKKEEGASEEIPPPREGEL